MALNLHKLIVMKLGVANRITVTELELDATIDVTPKYSEVVFLIDGGYEEMADLWLSILDR